MCGIAGYIDKSGRYKTNYDLIKKMTDKMIHRGPDAEGHWFDQNVALGHRRLSIIDLDAKSNQPMFSYDGRYVIIFNGEIYNYIEIKRKLSSEGAVFKTNSDTEVIIEAYRKFGIECFNLFNGMWAFALYDLEQQKVILCRDRFGIKPLYVINNEDVFAFASEMKAVIAAFPNEKIPNEVWIYRYLSYSKQEDCDEECFYKNIKNFPQACYMVYDLKGHVTKYGRYWDVDEQLFYKKWIQGKNPIKTFKNLFDNAVELRLRADVDVGACLSGGLDSSAIVGCVAKKFRKRIHTFSSIYDDIDCNEEMYIHEVNKKWDAIPHYIRPDDYEDDFIKYIKKIIYYNDQPLSDATYYSGYMVKRGVQGQVKVILNGQGADELFAGYKFYPSYYIYDLIDRNTVWSRCEAIKILTILKNEYPKGVGSMSTDIIVRTVGLKNSFMFQMDDCTKEFEQWKSMQLFTDDFRSMVYDKCANKHIHCSSHLNTQLCNDLMINIMPRILHGEDRDSMAFSIESRVPFLDYRIVEFAIALNGRYKIRNQWSKWIVRKACKGYLPRKVANRRNKMGFPAPFARWLREGKSQSEVEKIIYEFGNRNIVPKETIDRIYRAHMNMEADFNERLFRFLCLELCLRMCEK